MQHSAKGKPKILRECNLSQTSICPVDLIVRELAIIAFPNGNATLVETGLGISIAQVIAATEAELVVPDNFPEVRP